MKEKSIWTEQRPIHLLFFVVAIIGYVKSETLWGFAIFGMSLAITAVFSYLANRGKSKNK